MATQNDDIVPLSAADKRLEASLNRTKFACSDYMDNPNKQTDAGFSVASAGHVKALRRAGLTKQAGHMSKVDKDFLNAKTPSMKRRIVEVLARSLYGMTVKELRGWGIAAGMSLAGVVYALYEIKDGEVVCASDTNLDGNIDIMRVDTNGDTVSDYTVLDQDHDGLADTLINDDTGEKLAEGDLFEGAVEFFSNLFG
ncbi:unnamed protein product [Ectocarpus sp. 12 AP-2014]